MTLRCIYEASNSVEAHMILHLLEQSGISGQIDGEYLQGGLGELPAMGLVRVLVNESNTAKAKEIIEIWDTQQASHTPPQKKATKKTWPTTLLAFTSGIVAATIYFYTPIDYDGIDYNDDGVLDEEWIFVNNLISKTLIDRNLDGKVDLILKYNRHGLLRSAAVDSNFNGKFETKEKYDRGNITISKSDMDEDGFYEYAAHFRYGSITSEIYLDPKKKRILKTSRWDGLTLLSSDIDTDADGTLDTHHKYNAIAEIIETSPITEQK